MNVRNRLRADLREIAASAEISETAWDDICARIDAELSDPLSDTAVGGIPVRDRPNRPWRTALAVAAAAAIALVAATAGFDSWPWDDGDRLDTAGHQTVATSDDVVINVVSDYVDAINRGDVEEAIAQFDPDAAITGRHGSIRNSSDRASHRQWASRIAWLVGQEATITDLRCDPPVSTTEGTTTTCTWRLNDAVSQLIEQPGSIGSIRVTVADGEMVSYDETFDWSESQTLFTGWLLRNHPDRVMIDPFDWYADLSIEPAEGFGADYADYAREWLDVCSATSPPNASEAAAPTGTADTEGTCFQLE